MVFNLWGDSMSLRIYIRNEDNGIPEEKIIRDVEIEFLKICLTDNEYNKKAKKEIDEGYYNDKISFIDRFGFKLYTKYLSTGCKAAICVNEVKDKVIDLIECGCNALGFIVGNCTEGTILISPESLMFYSENPIDVIFDDIRFTSMDSLALYFEER